MFGFSKRDKRKAETRLNVLIALQLDRYTRGVTDYDINRIVRANQLHDDMKHVNQRISDERRNADTVADQLIGMLRADFEELLNVLEIERNPIEASNRMRKIIR